MVVAQLVLMRDLSIFSLTCHLAAYRMPQEQATVRCPVKRSYESLGPQPRESRGQAGYLN